MGFCGILMKAILPEVIMNLIRNMYSAITLLKLLLHLIVANELSDIALGQC